MQFTKLTLASVFLALVSGATDTITEHSSKMVTITECASSVTNCPFTSSANTSMTISTMHGMANRDTLGKVGLAAALAGGFLVL